MIFTCVVTPTVSVPDPTLGYAHLIMRMIVEPRSRVHANVAIAFDFLIDLEIDFRIDLVIDWMIDLEATFTYILNNTRRKYFCRIWRSI